MEIKIVKIPKNDGVFRKIYIPDYKTDNMLININKDLSRIIFPPYVCAFAKRRNVAKYIIPHLFRITKNKAMSMDIFQCFDSIKKKHIINSLKELLDKDMADKFKVIIPDIALKRIKSILDGEIDIITYNGFLPQGFRTSPIISNIVLLSIDNEIIERLKKEFNLKDLIYTRYADNILISSLKLEYNINMRRDIVEVINNILVGKDLKVNRRKIKLYLRKNNNHVKICGISINMETGEIKPPRRIRHMVRGLEYICSKIDKPDYNKLNGYIGYKNMVEHEYRVLKRKIKIDRCGGQKIKKEKEKEKERKEERKEERKDENM